MKKGLVIIPTYNEAVNIENIIGKILSVTDQLEILVLDDNSPAHTAEIVEKLS